MNELKVNGSGYSDPTAYAAMTNVMNETNSRDAKFNKLLGIIFTMCELSDFHIEERIVVKDLKTGKIYR